MSDMSVMKSDNVRVRVVGRFSRRKCDTRPGDLGFVRFTALGYFEHNTHDRVRGAVFTESSPA